ncbi:MAG: hypothetical protein ACFFCM_05060 [Promethearchaeota archaeon]
MTGRQNKIDPIQTGLIIGIICGIAVIFILAWKIKKKASKTLEKGNKVSDTINNSRK